MGFFDKVREALRDQTRDKLCARLCAIGVNAQMAPGRQRSESLESILAEQPRDVVELLGLIEVRDSPIRWVNVLKIVKNKGNAPTGYYRQEVLHESVYMVPDPSLATKSGYQLIQSSLVRSTPLIGRVIDIRWKSRFQDDRIRRLSEDVLLNRSLIKLKANITITSEGSHWAILSSGLSREMWDCYETIARHLLEPGGKTW